MCSCACFYNSLPSCIKKHHFHTRTLCLYMGDSVCVYVCAHMYVCMYVCMYVYMYTHTQTRTCTHTHTHSQTQNICIRLNSTFTFLFPVKLQPVMSRFPFLTTMNEWTWCFGRIVIDKVKSKYLDKKLSQCYVACHKSQGDLLGNILLSISKSQNTLNYH